MSSQVQISTTLKHVTTGLTVQSARSYTAAENEGAFIPTEVTATPESIDYGNIVSVKAVAVKVTGGDDVLVSLDGGSSYPLRIELNGGVVLPINSAGLVEISTVQAVADSDGSLAGTYFDLEDRNGDGDATTARNVRAWFNVPIKNKDSIQVTADTAGDLDGAGFFIYDNDANDVGVYFDHGNTGTAYPMDFDSLSVVRKIKITSVANGDNAATVMAAVTAAIAADADFTATDDGTDTVTIVNTEPGSRPGIFDSSDVPTGFTFASVQDGSTSSTTPATPSGGRLLQVDLTEDDTAAAVASAINTAFASDAEITATVADDTVTLTDKHTGTRTDISDTGSTGFTLATTQQGAAIPDIKIKSVGTSQVSTGAVPK